MGLTFYRISPTKNVKMNKYIIVQIVISVTKNDKAGKRGER